MDDEKNDNPTEAELQIERLKRLKDQKESKEKMLKEEVFKYAELPHAVAVTRKPDVHAKEQPAAAAEGTAEKAPAARNAAPRTKKQARASRIEKKNFEAVKNIVKSIKEANSAARLSEDMVVNIILARVLELGLDLKSAADAGGIRAILQKLKAE